MTANQERDKYLTEVVLKECWHECSAYYSSWDMELYTDSICKHCKTEDADNYDFSTWQGFGKLLEAAKELDDWAVFKNTYILDLYIKLEFITPDWLADSLYEWLKGRE